jgi:ribosomal RNA-processing protein 9
VATGGADSKLIIWSTEDLKPLRVFRQHRDAVTGLAFRRGTNQLYTTSADRTIKVWSLDELAYIETLFGHQDQVVDIDALAQERCVTVGARDRTVRLWKIVDEAQLVFRGGGSEKKSRKRDKKEEPAAEGSIDRVAFIDDDMFVTGSDNGAICLWSVHKKKPVYTLHTAHGRDPPLSPNDVFAEEHMEGREVPVGPEARWITALKVIPYSDLIVSGSWDGDVRIWRVTQDRKKIEALGVVGRVETKDIVMVNGDSEETTESGKAPSKVRGVINDLAIFEREDKNGEDQLGRSGLSCVVALGVHHRLGKWKKVPGGKNGAVVFEIPKKLLARAKNGDGDDSIDRAVEQL